MHDGRRTVVVTGASSGIGRACALRLDRAGWRVYAAVRRKEDAAELRRDASPRLRTLLVEVTDHEQVEAVAAAVEEPLHGLVNNAGVAVSAPLELLPLDELRRQLEVNVIGQVAVTQALLPNLRAARGRIVFIGSIGGRSALPFLAAYAASKFAIEAIADSLRVELLPFGIDVAVVEPGTIATPIWTKGGEVAAAIARGWSSEERELYRARMSAFRAAAAAAARRGEPAGAVAHVVERALTAKRPRTRYVVGRDARRRARVERLPDRLRDRVLDRYLLQTRPWSSSRERLRVFAHARRTWARRTRWTGR